MPTDSINVQLLMTGNEIMSGDTVDSNSALIARRLGEINVDVYRKVTVGDDSALLQRELTALCADADVVIINGGLGPTIDDLTAAILAEVAGVPLREHPDALAHLERWVAGRGLSLNAANRKQALLPEGCEVIPNPVGSAVGFAMAIGDCRVLCTPGVPGELRKMLDHVVDELSRLLGRPAQRQILRLQTFGLGESTAQQLISDAVPDWPQEVALGFRAGAPQMEIKLTIAETAHEPALRDCRQQLETLFGDHIIGTGDSTLAGTLVELLGTREETVTTAESCTGGLIASMLTRIPGSSVAFPGGFVTYSNELKSSVLGVAPALLEREGAVSEAVVREMAEGALARTGATYAVAVSGIAGPDGGTPEKPVGTVWIAWGRSGDLRTRGLLWPVERTLFQTMIAAAGLDLVRRQVLGLPETPRYFEQRRQR